MSEERLTCDLCNEKEKWTLTDTRDGKKLRFCDDHFAEFLEEKKSEFA